MALPDSAYCEQDVQKFVKDIAEILFSEEFNALRHELENHYFNANIENAFIAAFQDALFAILAQEDKIFIYPKGYEK
ncbi:hypothetical protein Tfer_3206 [Thermincola ferriacetica]|uniref:Uncharacterized protein n=2 Tax=Thermincola TaxID=278993 RepID=D5XF18_THEPJ|nr:MULTISPECIES: hypothetical protein [Thermincola]ADG82239.1 conserved hypothetical protein [Thermincola potens JR]KNZ68255.1 hypothetical protein Tfer_3206 [Thermincola ferriacetica]